MPARALHTDGRAASGVITSSRRARHPRRSPTRCPSAAAAPHQHHAADGHRSRDISMRLRRWLVEAALLRLVAGTAPACRSGSRSLNFRQLHLQEGFAVPSGCAQPKCRSIFSLVSGLSCPTIRALVPPIGEAVRWLVVAKPVAVQLAKILHEARCSPAERADAGAGPPARSPRR